jgi:hypothetical protein
MSFLERLYHFYFLDHTHTLVLYVGDWLVCVGYIAINVLVIGRQETTALYESMALSALILIVFPLLYCMKHDQR